MPTNTTPKPEQQRTEDAEADVAAELLERDQRLLGGKYRTTRSRSSVTSCGSGAGRWRSSARKDGGGVVRPFHRDWAPYCGEGTSASTVGASGKRPTISPTFTRRFSPCASLNEPFSRNRERTSASEVDHTGQAGDAVERAGLAPKLPTSDVPRNWS